ncbi:pyridoxamine 5'-phosphate oxidase family protein [Yoonia sp.]|uniref:pyridoxamine 5'-phosphate oxidase family protein n=1 Tax=Yoonia sp. TaxID=2212373 RepID=UPI002FDA6DE5
MTDWFETPEGIWQRLWQTLATGVTDPGHPARLPAFATVSPQGWPEARKVVLRSADQASATVTVHTDLYSGKIASLQATPRAALLIWDAGDALQIRLQAQVTIQSGDQTRALWDSVPDHARQSYGVTPPPGTPIPKALAYVKEPNPATFAVLTCTLSQIDAVHLGTAHRRAHFSRGRAWIGEWLSP